ncbi:TMEM165/GDT1 family protein [Sphingomonadaceae bacterium OTU29THOMA1]|uniref:TMEM165/GDT1 family protein n=1 Tax=Sphingomonas sp. Leaf37 TaxID=2876552 RepID=UPI001E5CA8A2|nr:TMEM165/GDT1 family protein [Sphingomonas sp. Leaf37]USU04514.1 TMEM165/GDT1 family protein [Sphingomonadaceae bacterium OTU29LAMAA1]USU11633.1 TMEM165/GDT1 family protein [Sphingomonadaceae bacterium OTU29THOMA1]
MAALVAAALAQVGDRPAWLAAILGDRYRAPGLVIAMAALALLGAGLLAAALGALLAPQLTPEAKQLFLAMSLLFQGGGALFPVKAPDRLAGWRIGAAATSLIGLFILAFGDGVQFVVLALAVRAELPWMAAVGAMLGSLAVVVPAVVLGERGWTALPLVAMRRTIAALFIVAAIWLGLGALRLI